jgi:hypothetical protein
MLEVSHENINAFLGLVLNPHQQSMIIYQYCPKGSLHVSRPETLKNLEPIIYILLEMNARTNENSHKTKSITILR